MGAVCCVIAGVTAVSVLLGWQFDSATLKSMLPGRVAMNPLTAVCFALSATALLVWREDSRGARDRFCAGLGLVIATCGFVRLLGYLSGWYLPIDSVLFAARLQGGGGLANRMAPNTAFNFILIGCALAALTFQLVALAQLFALGCGLIAFVALVGYAYSATSLLQVAGYIPMAFHTAALFLLVSVSIVCATPGLGIAASITRRTPGGHVVRRMLPSLILGPPALGWLRLQGELLGLYGPAVGVAFLVAAMVAMGFALTWATARAVDRGEVERRRSDEIIQRLAHFDQLTSLPNRVLFEDRLRRAVARAHREGGAVALLFLDLDGFKQVNDRLGHDAGDQVLRDAARRIETALRTVDTAARLGGDEFTVILEHIASTEDIQTVAQRLLLLLSRSYAVAGSEAHLSASVGVSVYPGDSRVPSELLSFADAAMYRAKRAGKNQVAFHVLSLA